MHPAQRVRLLFGIRRQPDVRHAAAVQQLLQIKSPEGSGRNRFARLSLSICVCHEVYLARAGKIANGKKIAASLFCYEREQNMYEDFLKEILSGCILL